MVIGIIVVLTAAGLCWFATGEIERLEQEMDDSLERVPLPEADDSDLEPGPSADFLQESHPALPPPNHTHVYTHILLPRGVDMPQPIDTRIGSIMYYDPSVPYAYQVVYRRKSNNPAIKWIKHELNSLPTTKGATHD